MFIFLGWISERAITKSARNLAVKAFWESSSTSDRPQLIFLPGKGTHVLYHKGLKVDVSMSSTPTSVHESGESLKQNKKTITLTAFGRDSGMLRTIIHVILANCFSRS